MSTNTPHEIEAHAEAERIWSLNFADRPTEEFEGLLAVVERGQRSDRLRAKLTPEYEFLHYHFVALRDIWTPLSALYGDENSGTRHGQYDTLVWLGVAERKVEDICDASGRLRGSKVFYRLAQESAPPAADIDPALYGLPQDSEIGPEFYPESEEPASPAGWDVAEPGPEQRTAIEAREIWNREFAGRPGFPESDFPRFLALHYQTVDRWNALVREARP